MYEKMELTTDEIRNGMYTGDKQKDLEMVNAFLSGGVNVKETSVEDVVAPDLTETVEEPTNEEPAVEGDEVELDQTQPVDPIEDQLSREQKYAEFLEQQAREERDRYLLESQKAKEDLDKERKAREELEKKLQELSLLNEQRPSMSDSPTDDELEEEDEYISDYAKKTRRMIEELASRLGDGPEVKQLKEEIGLLKSEYETERQRREELRRQQVEEENRKRSLDNIRDFQREFPEMKMSKDISEVENDYLQFRKDMAYLTKVRSHAELDKIIDDYRNGGEYKKLAESKGITMPKDYDIYQNIVEINDLKNGIKYDPNTGKEYPILNDEGERVKYRSFKEAYLVKTMEKRLREERVKAYKETAKKLTQLQSGAVELPTESVDSFSTGLTTEQETELLYADPKTYMNNPQKRELVRSVYQKRGLNPPTYRGQKI